MWFMTLQTEERLILDFQVIGYRPVRIMTNGTVIADRSMFKNERSLVTGMAVETEIIKTFISL